MSIFNKFFTKFAYKFPKGYPDLENSNDVLLLESLISKLVEEKFQLFEDTFYDVVGGNKLEDDIFVSTSNLLSGTGTTPSFGSIVQNGKFSAWALLEFVSALKSVDFPTFGKPTIPQRKLILLIIYSAGK